MLSVTIAVNGVAIYTRSVVNTGHKKGKKVKYECDDGNVIWHNPDDKAVALAHLMLNTIKEVE